MKNRIKIHVHTDCPVFGGCENMLPVFFNDKTLNEIYRFSFSYKYSSAYETELNRRLKRSVETYKINFKSRFFDKSLFETKLSFFNKFYKGIYLSFTPILFLIDVYRITIILFKVKPDIIHINNGGYPASRSCRAAVVAAKISGVKSVLMVVNNIAIRYNWFLHLLNYPLDTFVSRNVDLFITGSKAASLCLKIRLNLSDKKLKVIHNGIDDSHSKYSELDVKKKMKSFKISFEDKTIFGIIGLLTPRKGHFTLLNLLKNNNHDESFKNAIFLIIGSGELENQILTFLNVNRINNVVMIPHQDNVFEILKCIDVLIVPSVSHEDFPFVILEAMSLGKPIIGTSIAGIPEQIDHQINGFIIEPRNQEELGNAIKKLIHNPNIRSDYGNSSRKKYLNEFTSEISIKKYEIEYQKLYDKEN